MLKDLPPARPQHGLGFFGEATVLLVEHQAMRGGAPEPLIPRTRIRLAASKAVNLMSAFSQKRT